MIRMCKYKVIMRMVEVSNCYLSVIMPITTYCILILINISGLVYSLCGLLSAFLVRLLIADYYYMIVLTSRLAGYYFYVL